MPRPVPPTEITKEIRVGVFPYFRLAFRRFAGAERAVLHSLARAAPTDLPRHA